MTSLANHAARPGVENMLGHAPPPLAASGLDMRGGHPAQSSKCIWQDHQVEVLTPRRQIVGRDSSLLRLTTTASDRHRPAQSELVRKWMFGIYSERQAVARLLRQSFLDCEARRADGHLLPSRGLIVRSARPLH
jgi:hypothetical protein